MVALVEKDHPNELPYNPGRLGKINGVWRWLTEVEGVRERHQLMLDIMGVPEPESTFGIASFVVMEQEQPFLNNMGKVLAEAIAYQTTGRDVLLMTVESKGSHFLPWVWLNLRELRGERVLKRIITLRKSVKTYMERPARIKGQEVNVSGVKVPFISITSPEEQTLFISPKDAEFVVEAIERGVEPVLADDFIGKAGTIGAVYEQSQQLNQQLELLGIEFRFEPPRLVAVVGSDSDLYKPTLEKLGVTLLPQPYLPLRLPTFSRQDKLAPWRVNV